MRALMNSVTWVLPSALREGRNKELCTSIIFYLFHSTRLKQTKDTDTFTVWTQGMGSEKYGNGTVQNVNR